MKQRFLNDSLQDYLTEKQLAGLSAESIKDYKNLIQPFIIHCGAMEIIAAQEHLSHLDKIKGKNNA